MTISINFEKIWFLGILLTALIVIPNMQLGFEVGKVYWIWTLVEIGLVHRVFFQKLSSLPSLLIVSTLLWVGVFLLSSQLNLGNAFWGGWWRRQGFWTMLHLVGLWYLVGTSGLSKKFILHSMQVVILVVAAVGFLSGGRSSGSLWEANSLGLLMAIGTIASISLRKKTGIITALSLVFSQSRAAIMGLLVLLFNKKGWILTIVIGLLIFGFTLVRGGNERLFIWKETLGIWQHKPWLGIGLDNFQLTYAGVFYDQPHNLILWILACTGSLGLGSFVGWLYLIWQKITDNTWKKLLLAMVIYSMFQPFSITVWTYFFIILGGALCEE